MSGAGLSREKVRRERERERVSVLLCCLPETGRRKESYNVGVPTIAISIIFIIDWYKSVGACW